MPNPSVGYPILNLDPRDGDKLVQVRYNNDDRSAMKGVSVEDLDKWFVVFFFLRFFVEIMLICINNLSSSSLYI